MFDLSEDFKDFYKNHVCLGRALRNELAESRDLCMTRLENGLAKLGHGAWYGYINQGGYAMHTLNQAVNNNYDIDVALLFNEGDLPEMPVAARQRVRAGFLKTGGQFKETPSARTNAVTVWYATGEHLDFAVFRRRVDAWGNAILEHASGDEWKPRDPQIVTTWFDAEVTARSPAGPSVTVAPQQLRRIVRYVKFLTRAWPGWTLPGGMIITALVCENAVYRSDFTRDDVSLYRTLQSLHFRIAMNQHVVHPTEGKILTERLKRLGEVQNLKELLDKLMPRLAILEQASCTRAQARNAWRQFFNHEFWYAENDKGASLLKTAASVAPPVSFGTTPRVPVKEVGFG